jgi:hypothetical protein
MDWGSVSVIGGLVAASFGYLSRQLHRVEDKLTTRMDGRMDRLEGKLDKLTERYIEHLERRH